MLVRIAASPDVPALDKVPPNIKQKFVGLIVQAKPTSFLHQLIKKDDPGLCFASRKIKVGRNYFIIPVTNLLTAALEDEKSGGVYGNISAYLENNGFIWLDQSEVDRLYIRNDRLIVVTEDESRQVEISD